MSIKYFRKLNIVHTTIIDTEQLDLIIKNFLLGDKKLLETFSLIIVDLNLRQIKLLVFDLNESWDGNYLGSFTVVEII